MDNIYLCKKSDRIKQVPETFRRQYPKDRILFDGSSTDDTYKRLISLAPITEQSVNEILNKSWTEHLCELCKKDCPELVAIKGAGHDEYGDTLICRNCLETAMGLFDGIA